MKDAAALRLLLVAVVLFGGAWPVTKDALADATPLWFGTSRAALAALVAAVVLAALGRLRLPQPADRKAVLVLGLFQLGGFFALTHLAVALVPAGRTAVLSNVVMYWLIPLSVFVLGERVSRARWVAAGLGLAGAAVLVGPWSLDWSDRGVLIGHLMLVIAALLWSIAIIATRVWPPRAPMLELLPWCFGIGALVLAPLALLVQVPPMVPQALPVMLALTAIREIQAMLVLARLPVALDRPVMRVPTAPEATLATMARARLRVAQALRAMLGPTAMLAPQALRAQGPPMAGRDLRAALAQPVTMELARRMATLAPPVTPGMFRLLVTTSQCPEAQAAMAEMLAPAIMA